MRVNASLIKQLRSERSWTQQHLADACGVSLRTIQRVERYGTASNETLMALASVFEVEINEIQEPEIVAQVKTEEQSKTIKSDWLTSQVLSALLIGFVAGIMAVLIAQ